MPNFIQTCPCSIIRDTVPLICPKGGENMGSFGGFNEKKKKKQKQGDKKGQSSFSSAPVFVAPSVIKKGKKEE